MDPKLPAAASILVATLEKVRDKCRPGYMVSKFVVDWISEATAIAQAINASIAATPPTGADALDARKTTRLRGLLQICAESMRISMRNGGHTDWTYIIAGIDSALADTEPPVVAETEGAKNV